MEGTLEKREQDLADRFKKGTLTMDEFLAAREEAYQHPLPEAARLLYHDLSNDLMIQYEDRREEFMKLLANETSKQELREHFNPDLAGINPYYLGYHELDLIEAWRKKKLTQDAMPSAVQLQGILDRTQSDDQRKTLKLFYGWLGNQLQIALYSKHS